MKSRLSKTLAAVCMAGVLLASAALPAFASEPDYSAEIEAMDKWLDGSAGYFIDLHKLDVGAAIQYETALGSREDVVEFWEKQSTQPWVMAVCGTRPWASSIRTTTAYLYQAYKPVYPFIMR